MPGGDNSDGLLTILDGAVYQKMIYFTRERGLEFGVWDKLTFKNINYDRN
jgi:hypothetical protein